MASEARRKTGDVGDVLGSRCLSWRACKGEELGVQHNMSALYLTGRAALDL